MLSRAPSARVPRLIMANSWTDNRGEFRTGPLFAGYPHHMARAVLFRGSHSQVQHPGHDSKLMHRLSRTLFQRGKVQRPILCRVAGMRGKRAGGGIW